MSVQTAAMLLVGSRTAIERVVTSRAWLVPGALLVAAGGLARHYDQVGLAGELHVLLRGFTVSVINALVLYSFIYVISRAGEAATPAAPAELDPPGEVSGGPPGGQGSAGAPGLPPPPPPMPYWRGYLAFLGAFWMTAPMAWLYGVPYERIFEDPAQALARNLITLAFVSVWRVWLSTRILSIIFGVPMWRLIFPVMLFCDALLLLALVIAPLPPIDVMGGMERSPHDAMLADTAFAAGFFGTLSLPVWLAGTIVVAIKMRARPPGDLASRGALPRGAAIGAGVVLCLWIVACVLMQQQVWPPPQ